MAAAGWALIASAHVSNAQNFVAQAGAAHYALNAPLVIVRGADGRRLHGPNGESLSKNWSGYILGGTTQYKSASGTWIVPAVVYAHFGNSPELEASSSWVGIGGADSDRNLIQLGTIQEVASDGAASYGAWYETVVGHEDRQILLNTDKYPVSPGDVIDASIACTAQCAPHQRQTWLLKIKNGTEGWKWSVILHYASKLSSAEWIFEAPTASDGVNDVILPLPYYAPTPFSSLTVNGGNPNLSLAANGVTMRDPNGGASTPSYAIDGNSFATDFLAAAHTPSCKVGGECFSEWSIPTETSYPTGMAAGSDGALWFTEQTTNTIGRIAIDGNVTEYAVPTADSQPYGIAAGPDGALWFTERNTNNIGRIGTAGDIREYPVASGGGSFAIVSGPDGALWFTYANGFGRITTSGSATLYASIAVGSCLALGSDGALWSTSEFGNLVSRITTGGSITEFPIPTPDSNPECISAGPDGALWFTEYLGNKIGRVTTQGSFAEYPIPTATSGPWSIAAGADGALWFAEIVANKLARISTKDGQMDEFPVPTPNSIPDAVTAGPDGGIWFTDYLSNKIGRVLRPVGK